MPYDPKIHHRKSIRLKGYDYSQDGLYFVTICCENKVCRFGNIKDGEMYLNEYGKIAYTQWLKLGERFTNCELDDFQIMPNHMHGIIVLNNPVTQTRLVSKNAENNTAGATLAVAPNDENNEIIETERAGASPAPTGATLGNIIGAYKSIVANECLKIYKSKNARMGKLWQRNYYEIIIRNQHSYQRISEYIINNPAKWDSDKFYIYK